MDLKNLITIDDQIIYELFRLKELVTLSLPKNSITIDDQVFYEPFGLKELAILFA